MNKQRIATSCRWLAVLLISTLVAACGGGDQGRGPVLGLPAAALTSLAVSPLTNTVPIGATQQFVATATYADGASRIVTDSTSWSSSAAATVTVGATTGLATGIKPGSALLNASFGGLSANANLTVAPATLVSIAVTPANSSIALGATAQFKATGTFSDGSAQDITAIAAFSSVTPSHATVTAAGLASGVGAGTSLIVAASGTVSGNTTLTVLPSTLVSLLLTPANPTLFVGESAQMVVTATYSDNSSVNVSTTSAFISASGANASIGASSGLVGGVAPGTSVLSASFGGRVASTTVTVVAAPIPDPIPTPPPGVTLTSITMAPANASISAGTSQSFVATAHYSDNSSAVITSATSWTSGTTSVATVVQSGVASGLSVGSTIITASAGGMNATANLTVTAPVAVTLSSITISPASASITVGATQPFVATAHYSDNSSAVITSVASWTSGTTSVATVLSTGVASGLSAGSTIITASSGGRNATANLTVTALVPVTPGVNLRSAASFGVLAGTSITNNSGGTTLVTGNVGSPSQTVDPVQAAGFTNYKSGAILASALSDLQLAITDANSRICDVTSAAGIDLGGRTFTPGVYCYAGSINITGTFTMNGPGVYIFRTASTLDTTANSIVALTGGADASGVFWVPVAPTTLGATSVFKGSIMGRSAAITLGDGANLQNGRVLTAAAATLRNNVITP